jgi:sorbitol/mannitol transport system substrate-binding protein
MKSLFNTVAAVAVATTGATAVSAQDLTIAIVNNGHMINMQKVAEAYTAETGVN